jgi:hypothetical protein
MKKNLHLQTDTKYYKLSLITSMALWDGYLCKRNGTLVIQHSEKQKGYLQWKVDKINSAFGVNVKIRSYTSKHGFDFCKINFTNSITKRLRNIIYINNKKVLSKKVIALLKTPVALAIMYLDDGSLTLHRDSVTKVVKSREVYIATNSFSWEEVDAFCCWLYRNYKIKCNTTTDKGNPRIRMGAISAGNLFSLFVDIPDNMLYKLNMHYVNKCSIFTQDAER